MYAAPNNYELPFGALLEYSFFDFALRDTSMDVTLICTFYLCFCNSNTETVLGCHQGNCFTRPGRDEIGLAPPAFCRILAFLTSADRAPPASDTWKLQQSRPASSSCSHHLQCCLGALLLERQPKVKEEPANAKIIKPSASVFYDLR
jgi:hypothetical protein